LWHNFQTDRIKHIKYLSISHVQRNNTVEPVLKYISSGKYCSMHSEEFKVTTKTACFPCSLRPQVQVFLERYLTIQYPLSLT